MLLLSARDRYYAVALSARVNGDYLYLARGSKYAISDMDCYWYCYFCFYYCNFNRYKEEKISYLIPDVPNGLMEKKLKSRDSNGRCFLLAK